MANRKNREIIQVEKFTVGFLNREIFGKGRLATVNFTKKKDGTERTLNGKKLVKSALRGGDAAYDAEARNQVRVCDVNLRENGKRTQGYRTVTLDNINWITANGKKYIPAVKTAPKLNFVQGIQHNSNLNTLRVVLNKHVYVYYGVERSTYLNFIDAESKGQFFNDHIKDLYAFKKLS